MARRLALAGFGCLITLALLPIVATRAPAMQLSSNFVNEVLLPSLNLPTSLAVLPDARVPTTDQTTAEVRLFVNGHLASTDPVLVPTGVYTTGYERGLLGIAVDPGWPEWPFIYVYYSGDGGACRLVRYKGSGAIDDPLGENLTFGSPLALI